MATRGAPKGSKNGGTSAREAPFKSALNRAIAQNPKKVMGAVMKLLELAEGGESWAVKELADRLDGKAVQTLVGDPDQPLIVEVVRFGEA